MRDAVVLASPHGLRISGVGNARADRFLARPVSTAPVRSSSPNAPTSPRCVRGSDAWGTRFGRVAPDRSLVELGIGGGRNRSSYCAGTRANRSDDITLSVPRPSMELPGRRPPISPALTTDLSLHPTRSEHARTAAAPSDTDLDRCLSRCFEVCPYVCCGSCAWIATSVFVFVIACLGALLIATQSELIAAGVTLGVMVPCWVFVIVGLRCANSELEFPIAVAVLGLAIATAMLPAGTHPVRCSLPRLDNSSCGLQVCCGDPRTGSMSPTSTTRR